LSVPLDAPDRSVPIWIIATAPPSLRDGLTWAAPFAVTPLAAAASRVRRHAQLVADMRSWYRPRDLLAAVQGHKAPDSATLHWRSRASSSDLQRVDARVRA
jgi:hypothetical protein